MDDKTRFTMRISNDLYAKVKEQAIKNKRSIAKEIEFILEHAIENASNIENPPRS